MFYNNNVYHYSIINIYIRSGQISRTYTITIENCEDICVL